jgi:hypothetical protein
MERSCSEKLALAQLVRTLPHPLELSECLLRLTVLWELVWRRELWKQMKNGVLWDVTPCGSCKNRRFGGT